MRIVSGDDADRSTFDEMELELSALLDQWDPIGVYQGDDRNHLPGEYDDLVRPILEQLRQATSPHSLAAALQQVLADDYGLSAVRGVEPFSARTSHWWLGRRAG